MNKLAKDIGREAVVVLAGAVLAAAILQCFPKLKAWVREQLP